MAALSFNSSVLCSGSSLMLRNKMQTKYQHVPGIDAGASAHKAFHFPSPWGAQLWRPTENRKWKSCISFASGENVIIETSDKSSESNDQSKTVNLSSQTTSERESQSLASAEAELESPTPSISNGSILTSDQTQDISSAKMKSTPIGASRLTAREKLRAARVLNRKTEPKVSTPRLGSKVLEVLKESDKGKRRPGLPEAPTNLLDDQKRGMPKKGLTFELPGGVDVYLIIFSVVFISTVMFTTTYIVWKVGAIHFNEY